MDNKKRVSAVKAAVVQRGPGAPFKPKMEKAKKGKGSYTRKKKNFRDFREEVIVENLVSQIAQKLDIKDTKQASKEINTKIKKHLGFSPTQDPLYWAVFTAKDTTAMMKAMKTLESIRGPDALKNLQNAVRKTMSEELVNEEKCNCDCGEDPCVTCGKSHHMQESLEISENKEQWGKVFDNLKKGDKISVQWKSVMSSSPKEPVTFVAVRKSHSKKYGVTKWTIAREGEPSGRVKKFLYQRGGAGNAPTMAIGDMGVSLTHLSKAVNESTLHERSLTDDEKGKKERYVKGMKKKFSGFRDRYGEDAKSVMYGTATNMAKEEVELNEAKYDLYHKDFSSAMQHAYAMAKKLYGITIDPKEIDDKVATGPRKPSEGKTNSYILKGDKGGIAVQVYNKGGTKPFELNMYKVKG